MSEKILKVIKEVVAPMVHVDGGELYVVSANDNDVALHLVGRFAGCPGNQVAARRVIEPAIAAVAPRARVQVSWGYLVPAGATKIAASTEAPPTSAPATT